MRALVHDPVAPHGLRLGQAADPTPEPGQVLVRVQATSLNFGEVAFLADHVQPGDVAGWDAAGTVIAAAPDGSGPEPGSAVVTFGWAGAWGELRAVDADQLAVLPDGLDPGAAAALPVAAVTALRAIRRLGAVIGRRVLITGASGGVGRFAAQLASRAGADVVALAGSPERAEGLRQLGVSEVVFGLDELTAPVDAVLENVGGDVLTQALDHLSPGGTVLSIGMASLQPTTIDFERMRMRAGGARIEAFVVGSSFGEDLSHLVALLHAGALDPQIGWRGPWERVEEAAGALLGRRVRGKAVLEVTAA